MPWKFVSVGSRAIGPGVIGLLAMLSPSLFVPGSDISRAQVTGEERYFAQTDFRIDDDAIWAYFQNAGGVGTLGYPVSRTFMFLGCPVQIFQRHVLQRCLGQDPHPLNLLDPELLPYTQVNGSTFPAADDALKSAAPKVDQVDYGERMIEFVRANAPDEWNGQPVNFGRTFFASVPPERAVTSAPGIRGLLALEVWGAPISRPQPDPNNPGFVYQRFQRGVMHFQADRSVTEGILLADYFKAILLGPERAGAALPNDLRTQAANSRLFGQYCPGNPRGWLCRPDELPGTDLTFALEPTSVKVVATVTPAPTLTPTPPAANGAERGVTPNPQIFLQDSLTDPKNPNVWFVGTASNGNSISLTKDGYRFFGAVPSNFYTGGFTSSTLLTDMRLEVDATETRGSGMFDSFGINCRVADPDNFIVMAIYSDGRYVIVKRKNAQWIYFPAFPKDNYPHARQGLIKPRGQTNRLRADCIGNSFTLYANGEKLATQIDTDFKAGGFAFHIANHDNPNGHEVIFKNFVAYTLSTS